MRKGIIGLLAGLSFLYAHTALAQDMVRYEQELQIADGSNEDTEKKVVKKQAKKQKVKKESTKKDEDKKDEAKKDDGKKHHAKKHHHKHSHKHSNKHRHEQDFERTHDSGHQRGKGKQRRTSFDVDNKYAPSKMNFEQIENNLPMNEVAPEHR